MTETVASVETLTREQLYEKVWADPMLQVARSFGIPSAALAKICRNLKVPVPTKGYWWKKELGFPVEPTPLPESNIAAGKKKDEDLIVVPALLIDPHPLVEKTERSLSSAKADEEGRVRPKARGCLGVCVGPKSIDRAMRIMDALIKALEHRGYFVAASSEKEGETWVTVSEEKIRVTLEELLDRREREFTPEQRRDRERCPAIYESMRPGYDRFLSGRLSLRIENCPNLSNGHRKWFDGSKQRIEDRLNSVVASLIQAAKDIKESHRRHQEWERQREENERRRREEEQQKRAEEWRAKTLESTLVEWQHAQQIQGFISAVRAEAIQRNGEIHDESEIAQWLVWAERYAAQQDPIAAGKELPRYSPDDETRRKLDWSSQWGGYSSGYAWSPPNKPR